MEADYKLSSDNLDDIVEIIKSDGYKLIDKELDRIIGMMENDVLTYRLEEGSIETLAQKKLVAEGARTLQRKLMLHLRKLVERHGITQ